MTFFLIRFRSVLEEFSQFTSKFRFSTTKTFDLLIFEMARSRTRDTSSDSTSFVNNGSFESDGCEEEVGVNQLYRQK